MKDKLPIYLDAQEIQVLISYKIDLYAKRLDINADIEELKVIEKEVEDLTAMRDIIKEQPKREVVDDMLQSICALEAEDKVISIDAPKIKRESMERMQEALDFLSHTAKVIPFKREENE